MTSNTDLLDHKLQNWGANQTAAERLAADLLRLEGYVSVNPQCPLGGPDGLKDMVCEKNNWKYIGAAYFPSTKKNFNDIKEKFFHDLPGVDKNDADGLVFITNQYLNAGDQIKLINIAAKNGHKAVVLSLEGIRNILCSPLGFGARLNHFGIELSLEEQTSFFSNWGANFPEMLDNHEKNIINHLSHKIDLLMKESARQGNQLDNFIYATQAVGLISLPPSNKADIVLPISGPASSELTVEILCMIHKSLLIDYPYAEELGILRTQDVWVGSPNTPKERAVYTPPKPSDVSKLLKDLLVKWINGYETLATSKIQQVILDAIVDFHHQFLMIHPFLDGNGRVARFILMQQANELLGFKKRLVLADSASYTAALVSADAGDKTMLKRTITQAIYGVETIPDSI